MSEHTTIKTGGINGDISQHAFLRDGGVLVSMEGAAAPSKPTYSENEDQESGHIKWGKTDDDPAKWRRKLEKSSTAYPLIVDYVGMVFGKGVCYWIEEKEEDGIKKNHSAIKEVDEFFERNNIDDLMLERLMDFKVSWNMFCHFIKDKKVATQKITRIIHMESEFSRFSPIDKNTKKSKKIHYAGNWSNPEDVQKIPFLHKQDLNMEGMRAKPLKKEFAFHSCFPSPGHTLYAKPAHYGILRDNGWLDYANSIPEIKNSINDNALNFKYHVKIPYTHWTTKYKDWQTKSEKEQKKLMAEELDSLEKWFTGNKNAAKAFYSHYGTDPFTGQKIDGWEIIVIDDKAQKDAFNTSLQEADSQIARALNMDVSMAGIQAQGGKMGAGSGSDKRVGFDNSLLISHAVGLKVLEPLYIVKKYNGWPSNLKFGFLRDKPTTLNESPTGIIPEE